MTVKTAKAIVLAGDCRGPEPWPDLGLAARQLAPIANKPILFHHLEALARVGVRETAVVTDVLTDAGIRDAVGDGSSWGMDVRYVTQDGRDDVLTAPALADFVDGAPLIVQHGDVLLRERVGTLWERFSDAALDALVLYPGHRANGTNGGGLPTATAYMIGGAVQADLRREAGAHPAQGLDELLARLRDNGASVQAWAVDACLPCRGRAEALLEANRWMLEDIEPIEPGDKVVRSEVQGRVAIHPTAEVRDSLIRGPVSIAAGACISDAYIGPYTSIGANVAIESIEVEHSIVLHSAKLRFLGARLDGSLVGPGAEITREFHVPRAMRLCVGERAEIALA
jgi:glucose-1-phosphate thymidylyltransferase